MSSGVMVKGSGFVHTTTYLEDEYGTDVLQEILSQMPADSAKVVQRALVMSMYPVEHVGELLDGIKTVLGSRDPEINFKINLAAAKASFSTLYKLFFRLGSPGYVIGKATSVFSRFCSEGKLDVVDSDKHHTTLQLTGFTYRHPEFCTHRLRGWYQAPLELSGCRVSHSEHTACVLRGDKHCEWEYRW